MIGLLTATRKSYAVLPLIVPMTSRSLPLNSIRIGSSMWILLLLTILIVYTENITVKAAGTARNRRKNGNPQSRSVRVMNKSGARIDIFWIHPNTRELAPSHTDGEGVMYGGETGISSYIGHEFEVVELPSKKTQKCIDKVCRKAYFTVNTKEDQCKLSIRMHNSSANLSISTHSS